MDISLVMPMPPCIWMACWPTNCSALPTRTLAAETSLRRSSGAAGCTLTAARTVIDLARSWWVWGALSGEEGGRGVVGPGRRAARARPAVPAHGGRRHAHIGERQVGAAL